MANQSLGPPYFEVTTPLGIRIRTSFSHWERIVTFKHPTMAGKEQEVQTALRNPIEIRRSRSDSDVYLYYQLEPPYLICVVARHLNGEGFIITAYRTDKMKIGESVWTP